MSITAFTGWSATAASNVDLNGIPLSDSMLANQIDDAFREMMAQLKSGVLSLAGGTITGDLTISKASPAIQIRKSAAAQYGVIALQNGTSNRWQFGVDNGAESGANAGSGFFVLRYDDSGNQIDTPLAISRATGVVTFADGISVGTIANETAISQGAGISSGSGSITTASGDRSYTKVGRQVTVTFTYTISAIGTAGTSVLLTLPFTAASSGGPWVGPIAQTSAVGSMMYATIAEGASTAVVSYVPFIANGTYLLTITYWAAS